MKISPIIKERFDTLDIALLRKSGNKTLSAKTREKLAFIANGQFKCGAGAAFTGRLPPAPHRESTHAQLRLEALRNTLMTQQMKSPPGSCLQRYLAGVLERLPYPQLIESHRSHPKVMPTGSRVSKKPAPDFDPQPLKGILRGGGMQSGPNAKTSFGGATIKTFEDHPGESRTGDKPLSARAQLVQFMADGPEVGYSPGERRRLWEAALDAKSTRPFAESVVQEAAKRASASGKTDLLPSLEALVEVIYQAGAKRTAA